MSRVPYFMKYLLRGQGWGRTALLKSWAESVRDYIDSSALHTARAQHISREAARYSTCTPPKTVEQKLAVYTRQNHPHGLGGRLRPKLSPAQARRLRKTENRAKRGAK